MIKNIELETIQTEFKDELPDNIESLQNKINVLKNVAVSLIEELEAMQFVRLYNVQTGIKLKQEMRKFEIHLIEVALRRTNGNQTRAAKLLGLNLTTLNNKIKRLKLSTKFNSESTSLQDNNTALKIEEVNA